MIDSVLILSAGRGSRLGEYTESTPKPLLEIISPGITVIDRLLGQCKEAFGNVPVYVNISYLAANFLKHFSIESVQNRPNFIFEQNPLGPSKSLVEFQALGFLSTLVIHGDLVLSDLEFTKFTNLVKISNSQLLVCHKRPVLSARSRVETINGRVTSIRECNGTSQSISSEKEISVCSGIYLIHTDSIKGFNPEMGASLSPELLNYSINKHETLKYDWEDWRFSIDSPEVYLRCKEFLEKLL
jgi:NDP-sugar pyrophosphorylase family protein